MEAIKQANEEPETSAAVKTRMQELQKQHTEEVRTLYEWHAQDYYDEMLDLSRSEDRKSTRLNSSHSGESRMPSSA